MKYLIISSLLAILIGCKQNQVCNSEVQIHIENYLNLKSKIKISNGTDYIEMEMNKAALFGLNNPGANATQQQTQLIQQTYSQLLIQFNFSSIDINNFNLAQINASSSNRLPTQNCQ